LSFFPFLIVVLCRRAPFSPLRPLGVKISPLCPAKGRPRRSGSRELELNEKVKKATSYSEVAFLLGKVAFGKVCYDKIMKKCVKQFKKH